MTVAAIAQGALPVRTDRNTLQKLGFKCSHIANVSEIARADREEVRGGTLTRRGCGNSLPFYSRE